jgi:tetratricopeptide (TPR) repeat protein
MFEMALKYLERSAIRAERIHAFREAIEYYSQILGILTAFTSPEESAEKILEVLLKQSYIHQNLGEMDEARKDLEQAEGLLSLTHPPRLTVIIIYAWLSTATAPGNTQMPKIR